MPHDQNALGVGRNLGESAEHFAVGPVGQPLGRVRDRQPQQLVHFIAGDEVTAVAAGRPVVDDLGAARNRIAHRAQPRAQMRALAGLLEDLAHGGDRFDLARIEFAFRQ